ncbi:MAG: translation initiation factor IF-2 N-terminal domain-containing protein [Verrucomicrobia bacterium]|nr:translation initiation factor IF-2 N-terminal domain-containing protein [Verrucomicrobiota bacterium]
MPTRIYELAKRLGLESKEVLRAAKAMGIREAKVPSSSLDDFHVEKLANHFPKQKPTNTIGQERTTAVDSPAPAKHQPVTGAPPTAKHQRTPPAVSETGSERETVPRLEFSVHVSGTWAATFQRMLTSGKIELAISFGSDAGEPQTRLALIPQREPAAGNKVQKTPIQVDERTRTLLLAAYRASSVNKEGQPVTLAQFGEILKRLNPDFKPAALGASSLTELVRELGGLFEVTTDNSFQPPVTYVRAKTSQSSEPIGQQREQPVLPINQRSTGGIVNLKPGFGFIKPDAGGENIFFSASEVEYPGFGGLALGSRVEYTAGTNDKGPCARQVRLVA